MDDTDAPTIARAIVRVIKELSTQRLRVVAVVTDNGSNEVKALNPNVAQSVQGRLRRGVLRIPCFSHGTNLAIGDWAQNDLEPPGSPPGADVFITAVHDILRELRHAKPPALPLAPKLNKTRWFDLGQGVAYIASHSAVIAQVAGAATQARLVEWDFSALNTCFATIEQFLRWTEHRSAKLCDALGEVFACRDRLLVLAMDGNPYAAKLADRFLYRMYVTQDLAAMMLSYLLTERGCLWYNALPAEGDDSQAKVRDLIRGPVAYFEKILGARRGLIGETLLSYLAQGYAEPAPEPSKFWRGVWAGLDAGRPNAQERCFMPLADMAIIICGLPLSEADAERVFSHMRQLFGDRSQSTGDDLIEARLMLKLHSRGGSLQMAEGLYAFDAMAGDVAVRLQHYIEVSPRALHWGDFTLSKTIARQYPKTPAPLRQPKLRAPWARPDPAGV